MSKRKKLVGLPPGSLVFTGNQKVDTTSIHFFRFNESTISERQLDSHKAVAFIPPSENEVYWYDIRGIHDVDLISKIGEHFNIHSLILEDVMDVAQRPKFEEYEKGAFVSFRSVSFNPDLFKIQTEQVAVYFRKGLVISFQETESDLFQAIRHRLLKGSGKIRQRGGDYLAYTLIDVIVDQYFVILEQIGMQCMILEEEVLSDQNEGIKNRIHRLRKNLLTMRKSVAPLREAVGQFSKMGSLHVESGTALFIRDLYDHNIQAIELIESYRDLLNGLQDLFLSEMSFKMNQIMKVLTLVSTIFIPLSFLAGVYGMNFDHMPELKYRYGYYMLLGLMMMIIIGFLGFFKWKKWI